MCNQFGLVDEPPIKLGTVDFFEIVIEFEVGRDLTGHAPGFPGRDEETVAVVRQRFEEFPDTGIDVGFELPSIIESLTVKLDGFLGLGGI